MSCVTGPRLLRLRVETAALPSHTTVESLLELDDYHEIAYETRMNWMDAISALFLGESKPDHAACVRNFDVVLKSDGTIETFDDPCSKATPEKDQLRMYPAKYRIPKAILDHTSSVEDKVKRVELFALGCILYQLISGNAIFPDLGDDKEQEVQERYVNGSFPADVWELDKAMRILACWSPDFAKEVAESVESRHHSNFGQKLGSYIQKHPVVFGFQVLGGAASIASIFALPYLGALGFRAAGPIANSAAAGWQSSLGLVQPGSLFAWCQSAAMGGGALGGILATGLSGAGIAVAASVTGALDGKIEDVMPDLKKKFLQSWEREIGGDHDATLGKNEPSIRYSAHKSRLRSKL